MIGRFLILNNSYPNGDYPEDRLRQIFFQCIDHVQEGAKESQIKPNRWLVIYNSQLMDHSVPLYVHSIDEDTPEVILRKFVDIDQSGEARGKDSLVTQKFVIEIAAIESLPPEEVQGGQKKFRQYRHAGRGRMKRNGPFMHKINSDSLIEIDNDDAFCLFR